MPKQINNSGIYILELFAKRETTIKHPKFNESTLERGFYYYVGSAQKNLNQRIERHLRKSKKIYWHIDHLTTDNHILVKNVYILKGLAKNYECETAIALKEKLNLKTAVRNFGNSDCRNCESHLFFADIQISYSHLCSLYHSTVLFIPSSRDIN